MPMNQLALTIAASAIATFVIPQSTHAHHSASIYDMAQTVAVNGEVSRVNWANPHVYIYIHEVTDSGETIEWEIEAYPPAAMRRVGWSASTLRRGSSITVIGNPTRSAGKRGIFPITIEAGGQTLFQRASMIERLSEASVEAEVSASSLQGTWETLASLDLILHFYNPGIELTDAGRAAFDEYDESTMLPALNCIPYSAPLLMIDPDFKQISISEDAIKIHGGYAIAERTVHMDIATHESAPPTVQGHSVGRWEGQTLVIETTRFAPHRIGNAYRGVASGSRKHLVERLTLHDDGKRLTYPFELSDPEYLAETVTGEVEWAYRPGLEFVREECSIDSARRFTED